MLINNVFVVEALANKTQQFDISVSIYRERECQRRQMEKKRETERESERESKEKHTDKKSERHSEKITTTYYSDSEHVSSADQSHMFCKKSMPNKLESFDSGFMHRTKTQDKVLTQLLIGKPGASVFECDSDLSLANL